MKTKQALPLLLVLLGGWLLAGCAQTYHMRVDALADPQRADAGQTYVLENGFPERPGSSLRFEETAHLVARALDARGYSRVDRAEQADLLISVSASVSEPLSDTVRSMEPMYYHTWGRSQIVRTPVVDAKGNVSYIATRYYVPPETRFAGYAGRDRAIVVYEKELELTARTTEGEEVWTLVVATVDRSSDLRAYLPYLAAAATPYIGQATDGAVVVPVKEDAETVQYLRGNRSER